MNNYYIVTSTVVVVATLSFVSSCGGGSNSDSPVNNLSVPTKDHEKIKIRTVNQLKIDQVDHKVGFTELMKTGYKDNGEIFGALKDVNGNLIKHPDGSVVICNGTSNSPTVEGSGLDHTSIIQKDGKLHMIAQFECQVGAMYSAELKQSPSGKLSVVANTLKYISQAAYKGGWVHCAGSNTPWNSVIGSEEYEPDARQVEEKGALSDKYYASAKHYFGGDASKLNPYFYGWIPEVSIKNGKPVYQKHYAMGRASHELAYVMPDKKTVYMTDDGTNDGFYRFVADKPENLSKGTLYAAKWKQTTSVGAGSADISWIKLGQIDDAAVKKRVLADKLKFSDVFATDVVVDKATGKCHAGFTYINTERGSECLAYKDINHDAVVDDKDKALAAALETRRVAAMEGATTEFRKFEGFTYNARDKKAYIAMSSIERGMEDGFSVPKQSDKYDIGSNNDIKLSYNKCGAVYELSFDDSSDAMKVTSMKGMLAGKPLEQADKYGNGCHADYVSNPDNVAYIAKTDTLLIGEDTSKHTNNVVWAYNIDSKEMRRLATVPLDAETTSPYWYELGNFGYISLVSQHPMEDQAVGQEKKEDVFGMLGPILLN